MNDVLIIVLLVVVLLLAAFVIPQFLARRAASQVIRIFRINNAIGIKSAKTLDELGLRPRGMLDNMLKPRDYKPRALQALISANIIQTTEDGKVYLSEESLIGTRWGQY